MANTIIANSTGPNCSGTIIDGCYNLLFPGASGAGGSCTFGDPTNVAADPQLAALAVNAPGATATHAITRSSPAFDRIPSSVCPPPTTDQRGVSRPQFDSCDIRAFELAASAPVAGLSGRRVGLVGCGKPGRGEGVIAVAPLGFQLLFRRRRARGATRHKLAGSNRRERVRAAVT